MRIETVAIAPTTLLNPDRCAIAGCDEPPEYTTIYQRRQTLILTSHCEMHAGCILAGHDTVGYANGTMA